MCFVQSDIKGFLAIVVWRMITAEVRKVNVTSLLMVLTAYLLDSPSPLRRQSTQIAYIYFQNAEYIPWVCAIFFVLCTLKYATFWLRHVLEACNMKYADDVQVFSYIVRS